MIRSNIRVPFRAHVRFPLYGLLAFLLITLACAGSPAQTGAAAGTQIVAGDPGIAPELLDRQEIFRRIGIFEDFARRADSLHLDNQARIKIYKNLGILYDVAGMIPKAAAAMQRAIDLMKDGPQDDVAEEYNNLSAMHGLMGNSRQAEKDQMQALAIREKIGDPLGLALTWTDIAGLYCQELKYKKALEFAQKSYDVLADRTDIKPSNHIAVLQTMSFALCGSHQCSKGVPIMQRVVEEARTAFGPDSVSTAAEGFALGYVYWKNGDASDAADWMRRSLARMKTDLGWGAPLYVNSIKQYALFLHQTGEREEARSTENEIHMIESVVDARTMTTRGAEFLSPGNR